MNISNLKMWYRRNSLLIKICKKFIHNPITIVMINGGICSQMQQYLTGVFLKERNQKVEYDLSFYSIYQGTGVMARNFDLLNLFPNLELSISNEKKTTIYKKLFKYIPNNSSRASIRNIPNSPVYVDGYYDLNIEMYRRFHKIFHIDVNQLNLDQKNLYFYNLILNDPNSVGVHVRRGDMTSTGNYWKVLKPKYYEQAIKKFDLEKCNFYFFSDEIQWVQENVIPLFPDSLNYYFVNCNNSDKGYLDFLLLCTCKHQIASQGSFGKYAWILNTNTQKKLVLPNEKNNKKYEEIEEGIVEYIELDFDNCENP